MANQLEGFIFPEKAPDDLSVKILEQNLDKFFSALRAIINNGLTFTDNFNCHIEIITTNATPGVETAVTHGLKRIPVGLIILERLNKGGDIYLGGSGKDATTYNLASDVASLNAKIMIF